MRLAPSKALCFVLLSTAASCVGCGDSDWAYVTGTVKLNGTPVGPGTIMFEPASTADPRARSGVGNFNEDGTYAVRSAGGREGLPPGDYLVIIDGKSSGDEYIDPNQKSKIPPKYLNHNISGLKATVTPGEQTVDFNLEP